MNGPGLVLGDRAPLENDDGHASWIAAFSRSGNCRILAASAIGIRHRYRIRPRDDAFQVRLAGPWIAAAASDGVGGCFWSRLGAAVCCDALSRALIERAPRNFDYEEPDSLRERLRRASASKLVPEFSGAGSPSTGPCTSAGTLDWHWHPAGAVLAAEEERRRRDRDEDEGRVPEIPRKLEAIMVEAFREANDCLVRFAESRSMRLTDLSCTLMGVLLNTETGSIDAAHIGDGAVVVRRGSGYEFLPQPLARDEDGVPHRMSLPDWEQHLAIASDPGTNVNSIYMMTDCVFDDGNRPPCENLFSTWSEDADEEIRSRPDDEQAARWLLEWLAHYEHPDSGDDRTVIAIIR